MIDASLVAHEGAKAPSSQRAPMLANNAKYADQDFLFWGEVGKKSDISQVTDI